MTLAAGYQPVEFVHHDVFNWANECFDNIHSIESYVRLFQYIPSSAVESSKCINNGMYTIPIIGSL